MTSLIPPLPGDNVESYTLLETLGLGGNATVYKASSAEMGNIALKILHPGKTTPEDIKRFRREFLSLKSLKHPNIVQVYETGVHGHYPWISMELVQGTDLDHLIKQWQKSPPADRFQQIENILLSICVGDYGEARSFTLTYSGPRPSDPPGPLGRFGASKSVSYDGFE